MRRIGLGAKTARPTGESRIATTGRSEAAEIPGPGQKGESLREPPGGRGKSARPVPRMPKSRPETQVRSKGITLAGTLLILGLTVLAFAGGRLFGRVEEPDIGAPVETVAQTVPAPELAAVAPELTPVVETPMALPATFVRPPVVCLDPGHGGEDRGFSRFFENDIPAMEEAMLVLEQAWDLEARLQQRGYKVVMTRETDTAVNVDGRDVNGDGRTAAHDAHARTATKPLMSFRRGLTCVTPPTPIFSSRCISTGTRRVGHMDSRPGSPASDSSATEMRSLPP